MYQEDMVPFHIENSNKANDCGAAVCLLDSDKFWYPNKQASQSSETHSLDELLTPRQLYINCVIILQLKGPLQSDDRKPCMEEESKDTQSLVLLLKRPQGSVQLFKSTSGKNSPVLNPACSTTKCSIRVIFSIAEAESFPT